jgi:hypothetical protein
MKIVTATDTDFADSYSVGFSYDVIIMERYHFIIAAVFLRNFQYQH